MMSESRGMTRRQFTKVAVGGFATLMLGNLIGCAPRQTANTEASETVTCDVLVVGAGSAGATAVFQAAANGANAILIEKMSFPASSSALAQGGLYGAGTKIQEAAGVHDSSAALLEYFLSRGGDKLDYDIQKFCADHFGETIDWMHDEVGIPFDNAVAKRSVDTVPRLHQITHTNQDGVAAMLAHVREAGARIRYSTAAEKLVVDESGAVCGVLARTSLDKVINFQAKKVIMASGGFCRNDKMIDEYMPKFSGVYSEVGIGCTGEGLQMGLDLGAEYYGHGGTNGILSFPGEPGQSNLIDKNALWVNAAGKRFVNEDGQTHDIYYQVAGFDDQKFYVVYDQNMVNELDDESKRMVEDGLESGFISKGDTVEVAGDGMGINGAALAETLAAYNEMAAAGTDTEFKKASKYLKAIARAPFYVFQMTVCTHGSFGGYHVNTDMQVLDTSGEPIPNLYAVGEVSSGTFIYDDYPGCGCGLAWCYTSGRWAGINAARACNA